jgi:hypothetical protein
MQVYLDLSAIFPIDIVRIILRLMYDDFAFFHGRMHQLVVDRSRNIREKRDKYNRIISTRRQVSQEWISTHSRSEINQEAISTIAFTLKNTLRRKGTLEYNNDWYKIFDHMPINISVKSDYFYIGRSIQFILDTNNKYRPNFKEATENGIISVAHEEMTMIQNHRKQKYIPINQLVNLDDNLYFRKNW